MFKNLKFSKKIMVILGLTSFFIILGTGATTYLIIKNDLKKKADEELIQANKQAVNLIETTINNSVNNYLRAIAELGKNVTEHHYSLFKRGMITRDEAYRRTEEFILNPKNFKIGKTGYLAGVNSKGVLEIHQKDPGRDAGSFPFMQRAIKLKNGYIEYNWKNPGDKKKRKKFGWLAYFEPFDLIIWASAYMDEIEDFVDMSDLRKKILSIKLGNTGYIYVLSVKNDKTKGDLIIHPDPVWEGKNAYWYEDYANPKKYFIQEVIKNKDGTITYHWVNPTIDKEKKPREKIVAYKYLKKLDWIICSSFYFDDLYAPVRKLGKVIIIISLITLILIIIFSFFIGKSISKPIMQLAKGVDTIGKGNLEVKIPVEGKDEIGYLSGSFNKMANSLKISKEKIEHQRKELERAKTKLEDTVAERTKELETEKEKAESANRAKDIFISNISHDIRTPLTSILGNAELLAPDISDEEKVKRIENIKTNTRTIKEFIDNTLYMSKIERKILEIFLKPVDIYSILIEIRSNFSYRIERESLQYIEDINNDIPPFLELDKVRLKQVLRNLIDNAINYTDKGHIKLTIKKKRLSIVKDEQFVDLCIAVEDTGCGIAEENLSRVFEPFEQFDSVNNRQDDGTGLGLSIAKGIVELMGGEITVKSRLGKGSTFSILFRNIKVLPDDSVPPDPDEFDHTSVEFGEQTILVVDDRKAPREVIAGLLKNTNLTVTEAKSGEDALESIKKQKPDLIIMDLSLPGISGEEATKRIRDDDTLKNIPVFAFTAVRTDREEVKKHKNLFERYLFKPITKARLFYELAKFLKVNHLTAGLGKENEYIENMLTFNLTHKTREKLPEIINDLENHRELWKSAVRRNNFEELETFGRKIKETGTRYSIENLVDFGSKIISCAAEFRGRELKAISAHYPELVDKLKMLSKFSNQEEL